MFDGLSFQNHFDLLTVGSQGFLKKIIAFIGLDGLKEKIRLKESMINIHRVHVFVCIKI